MTYVCLLLLLIKVMIVALKFLWSSLQCELAGINFIKLKYCLLYSKVLEIRRGYCSRQLDVDTLTSRMYGAMYTSIPVQPLNITYTSILRAKTTYYRVFYKIKTYNLQKPPSQSIQKCFSRSLFQLFWE